MKDQERNRGEEDNCKKREEDNYKKEGRRLLQKEGIVRYLCFCEMLGGNSSSELSGKSTRFKKHLKCNYKEQGTI